MADLPSTPADGSTQIRVMTSVADLDNPTLAEWLAGVDLSLYYTSDGFTPSLSEQTISDDRLNSTQTYEQPGRHQRSLDVIYIDNTNTANPNLAKTTCVPGAALVLGIRRGMAWDAAAAASQLVDLWPIKPGQYSKLPPEANSVFKIAQKYFVTGAIKQDKALTGTLPVPTISAATPTAATQGSIVTITGRYFTGTTGAASVKFGATNATNYVVDSDTTIYATMPAGSAGAANIVVTNPTGASTAFTYTRGA